MNAKSVLSRIATLLLSEEVKFTDAKTADGTILQSPTFDLGEPVDVIGEDGEKTPAPDGEHEIALRDSEGKEVLIKIETKDGVITERENVELPEKEMEDVEEDMEKPKEEVVDKEPAEEKMADATTEEAKGLPNTTDESEANVVKESDDKDPLIRMSYRIEELEKKMEDMKMKFESAFPPEGQEVSSLVPDMQNMAAVKDEEELPKLDGAPIDLTDPAVVAQNNKNYGKKVQNSQASFLSRLYN